MAGPADRVAIEGGHVIRDGVRQADAYIAPRGNDSSCNFPSAIVVPPADYFMMGDNRGSPTKESRSRFASGNWGI